MSEAVVDLGYRPRPWQDHAHRHRRRYTVLVWHRGAGKTQWALQELLHEALRMEPTPDDPRRLAYIAPLRVQAQDVAWDRLISLATRIPGVEVFKAELRVVLPNGAIVQLYGADNPERIRGITLDGVVLDEVAQMPPSLFREVLLPALSRMGREGWCVWIGTPKGRNAFWDVYDATRKRMEDGHADAWADFQPVSLTRGLSDGALASARAQMTPEEYEQEFECSFQAAIVGAYYGREMAAAEADRRITRVPYDPGLATITAWDLGIGDSTAIWIAQRAGREVRLIDFIEGSSVGLDWYAGELHRRGYRLAETILPHDAAHRELIAGKSRLDTLRSLGLPRCRVLPAADVEDGIDAARRLLPACVFDAERTARGVEALRQYRRDWDERGQAFRPRPRHDWTSHAADAFRYLAMGLRPADEERERRMRGPLPRIRTWDPYSLEMS